jgi:hypothetical protein
MSICKREKKGYDAQLSPFLPSVYYPPPPSSLLPFPAADSLLSYFGWPTGSPRVNKSSQLELALALTLSFFSFISPAWPLCCPTLVSISAAAPVSLCIPVPSPCLPLPLRVPGPSRPTARPSSVFARQPTSTLPTLPPSPIRNTQETTRTPPTPQPTRSAQTSSPPLTPLRTTIWRTRRWERRCSDRRTSGHASLPRPIRGMRRASIHPHPRPKTFQCSYRTPYQISTILRRVS